MAEVTWYWTAAVADSGVQELRVGPARDRMRDLVAAEAERWSNQRTPTLCAFRDRGLVAVWCDALQTGTRDVQGRLTRADLVAIARDADAPDVIAQVLACFLTARPPDFTLEDGRVVLPAGWALTLPHLPHLPHLEESAWPPDGQGRTVSHRETFAARLYALSRDAEALKKARGAIALYADWLKPPALDSEAVRYIPLVGGPDLQEATRPIPKGEWGDEEPPQDSEPTTPLPQSTDPKRRRTRQPTMLVLLLIGALTLLTLTLLTTL